MTAFGLEIHEDVFALEIQYTYKKNFLSTKKMTDATETLLNEFSFIDEKEDDFSVFWLSLADIQLKLGHLDPTVKRKAIYIIDNNIDLKRWEEDKNLCIVRSEILTNFKDKLIVS